MPHRAASRHLCDHRNRHNSSIATFPAYGCKRIKKAVRPDSLIAFAAKYPGAVPFLFHFIIYHTAKLAAKLKGRRAAYDLDLLYPFKGRGIMILRIAKNIRVGIVAVLPQIGLDRPVGICAPGTYI